MQEMTKSHKCRSSRLIDLTGMVFNKLTMLEYIGPCKHGGSMWLAKCDCGNTTMVRSLYARSGHTQSCGCFVLQKLAEANTTHGESKSIEHSIWRKMIERCDNPRCKGYAYYGGRGIKVCQQWRQFANFLSDMGRRPSKNFSIDRIDVNGDYGPLNCRWASQNVQSNNKTNNLYLKIGGLSLTAAQFARIYNIPAGRIVQRKTQLKWNDRDAIFKPTLIKDQSWRTK